MSIVRRIADSHALGLGLVVALTVALAAWLFDSAEAEQQAGFERRRVLVEVNSLADALARVDREAVGGVLREWQARDPTRESARIVSGMELIGSTDAADMAPRRLNRDEKPLFDLAAQLRSARETNIGEGVVRKKLVQFDDKAGDAWVVTVPYFIGGDLSGAVQVRMRPSGAPTAKVSRGGTAILPAIMLAGFVFGALLRWRAGVRADWPRLLAMVAFLALTLSFAQWRLASQADADRAGTLQVAATVAAAAGHYGLPATGAAAPSPWDTDQYQRPLGAVRGDGSVAEDVRAAAFADRSRLLKRSMWAVEALGLVVLLAYLLGYTRRIADTLREHADAYGYVAPAMIGMLVLVFFPFLYGIAISFTDTTLFNESLPFAERWIGWGNFLTILGDFNLYERGPEGIVWNYQNFYWTLAVTVIWTITNVTVGVTLGFILAMILNTEDLRGRAIYRVVLILPWAIPNYITALVWRGMFHPQFGVINQILQMLGMEPVAWFDGVVSSFLTGLATNGWLSFPFMMVVILGALQSIPKDMYEAAEVEGATRWQRLRHITLPLLRPTLIPAIVLSVVWTFNMFNIIFLVSGGEPAGANEILVTKAYKIAFENYRYAYAAAYSTVIFVILLVYGAFQTRVTRATESF